MNDPQPEGHMASYIKRRKFVATLLGGAAAGLPLAAVAESNTQPLQESLATPPQIEAVRERHIAAAAPKLRFQVSGGRVDVIKPSRPDGFEGVGGAWKTSSTDGTLHARYGPW